MRQEKIKRYSLDNSAVIHLASRRKGHTNSFRISVMLLENVCPSILQKALDHITPHFPTIVAGIQRDVFQYEIVPVRKAPDIQQDQEYLAYMEDDRLASCAMRVLYGEKHIAVEIFHALTDGHGGFVFVRALIMEYYFIKKGCSAGERKKEWLEINMTDDYLTYAGKQTLVANHRNVYRIPGNGKKEQKTHITTGIYDVQNVLSAAHHFGVSLTVFLTAVMAVSIKELELKYEKEGNLKPIQIMVPVDLRKKFKSTSIRNFSLYALPCIEPSEFRMPFRTLAENISRQLQQQLSQEHLEKMISTNVKL